MHQQHEDQPIFASAPIEQVHEGMTVIDADGQHLGTVGRLQMGHPQAATAAGNEPLSPGLAGLSGGPAAAADGGPTTFGWLAESDLDGLGDVPDVLRQNLRRTGYIHVDGSGLEGANRFIPADRIAEVSGNSVRLRPVVAQVAQAQAHVVDSDVSRQTVPTASAAPRTENQPSVERTVFTSSREDTVVHWQDETEDRRSFGPRVLVSAGATTLVFGGAGTAAWMYRRWRREQSRPINRLRRATAGLGLSLPDSYAATGGPIAAALLLGALAWARRSSRGELPEVKPELVEAAPSVPDELSMTQQARGMLSSLTDVALSRQWAAWPPRRSVAGLVGGLLVLSGAGVLIWRSLNGRGDEFETEWTPPATDSQDQPRSSTVDTPHQTLTATAPGAREQVTIERHPVDRQPADRLIDAAEPESIEMPVHADQEKPLSSATPDEENSL